MNPNEEIITWQPVEPIDEDQTVLLCTDDGEVGTGYMQSLEWYWESDYRHAKPITARVTRMARMPIGPPLP